MPPPMRMGKWEHGEAVRLVVGARRHRRPAGLDLFDVVGVGGADGCQMGGNGDVAPRPPREHLVRCVRVVDADGDVAEGKPVIEVLDPDIGPVDPGLEEDVVREAELHRDPPRQRYDVDVAEEGVDLERPDVEVQPDAVLLTPGPGHVLGRRLTGGGEEHRGCHQRRSDSPE